MAQDKDAQMRNLITGYRDSMMLSDIKALIAVLFVAIMMGTVLQYRQQYPWYLSAPVILAPFMIIYVSLLISVYPRFPRAGRKRFPIWRNADPQDFDFVADTVAEIEGLPALCAGLSRILWWKNITLLTADILAIASLAAALILLFVARL
jgi:drug/metabolite transporter (DMT)-like permease